MPKRRVLNSFFTASLAALVAALVTALVTLTAVLLPSPVWAQEARVAKRMALLIGNQKYDQRGLDLNNPINDVNALADVLEKDLGFAARREFNLDIRKMDQVLNDFFKDAKGADVVLVYYAGHGVRGVHQDGEKDNFLLPVNADIWSSNSLAVERQAVSVIKLRDRVEQAKKRIGLLILDACREGPVRGRGDRGLQYVNAGDGMFVAYSTGEGRVASDNGFYAKALAAAFKEPRPVLDQLMSVAKKVETESRGKQRPEARGIMDYSAYLLPEYAPAVDPDIDDAAFKRCATAVTVDACQAYVIGYPQGRWLDQARNLQDVAKARQAAASAPNLAPAPTAAPQLVREVEVGKPWKECDVCPEMLVIPAGRFVMGDDKSGVSDEKPAHAVDVQAFMLGKYEVTVAQYLACVAAKACREPEWRETGSKYHYQKGSSAYYRKLGAALTDGQHPIIGVSWDDAKKYVAWLNAKTRGGYRLPSEAEWEYAARAGSSTKWHFGNDEAQLGEYAWYDSNAGNKTHALGGKLANQWGLHDMHGNVREWVEDCWYANYQGAPANGSAWLQNCSGEIRVLRGGSWGVNAAYSRSAIRYFDRPEYRVNFVGFRVARTPR